MADDKDKKPATPAKKESGFAAADAVCQGCARYNGQDDAPDHCIYLMHIVLNAGIEPAKILHDCGAFVPRPEA